MLNAADTDTLQSLALDARMLNADAANTATLRTCHCSITLPIISILDPQHSMLLTLDK
jgi:hypothetical protein